MLPIEIMSTLEGIYPAIYMTVSPDGIPNISLLSQVWYVDETHVALSNQFLNKSRINILANPYAIVRVSNPDTFLLWELNIKYLHTDTSGRIFEQLKLKIEAIASMMGMSDIFKLRGADIYEVLEVRPCYEYWEPGEYHDE
jgi:adenylate cyclase